MVDERETTNGNGCDLNCSMGPTSNDKSGLLVDCSNGGASFGEGTSAEGLRIYKRRKRNCNSDEKPNSEFNNKIKTSDGSASHEDACRLSFDECSPRHCRKIVLQQMYQSLSGCKDGLGDCIRNALVTSPESGCTSAIKENLDSVGRSDNQTHNSKKELSHGMSSGFFDILVSDKFSELCGLLVKNFGAVNVHRILDINAINTRMKNGAYEASPILYLKDIQQVWTKLQQVGNEMVTLANSLSDKSRVHYERFVRKPKATDACGASNCQGCGENADVRHCLVCDSCEEIYHISCSELIGTEIPPKSWYCITCVSNGIGSPHDNCVVCAKIRASASTSTIPTNEEIHVSDVHESKDGCQEGSKICFICKSEVTTEDNFRTCGHSVCAHKFYHYRCLTSKQLGVCGPCWYCPSCLCRRCLVDKDDDQIVLCDGCDQAYHIYCTSPRLNTIPKESWFCGKCDRDLKRIRIMKMVYEKMQKKVKAEVNGSEKAVEDESGGLDMLVTAAKTLRHQETMEILRNTR